jgi:hypothetical protein
LINSNAQSLERRIKALWETLHPDPEVNLLQDLLIRLLDQTIQYKTGRPPIEDQKALYQYARMNGEIEHAERLKRLISSLGRH